MRAVFLERHGGAEALRVGEQPEPSPAPTEVVVRLEAAALNRVDLFVRQGMPGVPISFPHIPGADGFGTVERLPEKLGGKRDDEVDDLAVGQRVVLQPGVSCGRCEFCRDGEKSLCIRYQILGEHRAGTFAEKVAVPRENVFPAPGGLSPEEAAAFPLALLTAWRMIVTRASLRPGESVLIHGIGGGVSLFALQVAKLAGAGLVIVTSSHDGKLERAQALGADVALNYKGVDVARRVRELTGKRGVDVVVDSVGAATWRTSLQAAAKRGRIVTCGATTGPNPEEELRIIFWKQLTILGSTMGTDAEFSALLRAVEGGRLCPQVDSVFPLEEASRAYERLESGLVFGKVVLRVS